MPRPDHRGPWGPPHGGPPNWGPGRHMFRRALLFIAFLVLLATLAGALLVTVLSALGGPGRWIVPGLVVLTLIVLGTIARRRLGRTWTPVSELIDATTQLGKGDTSIRMNETSRGPFSPIASSFNQMAERLEEEDIRRRRLLADLGHEMRTPLTVIRGQIEAVLDGLHSPDSLTNVVDEVALMERLLEDLRVLTLTEAGRLQLHPEAVDVGALVTDVVASFSVTHANAGISVDIDTEEGLAEIDADPHRLHQVVANLVSNATNQMPHGGKLVVSVSQHEAETKVTVSDTGPGIPEERLGQIFERFTKGGDSAGTGLGLSIARDLVEAHGGTLIAENLPTGGARFTFRLLSS